MMGDFTGCCSQPPHNLGRGLISIWFSFKTNLLLNLQHPDSLQSSVGEGGKGEDWQQGCSQPQLCFTKEVMNTELCRAQLYAVEKTNLKRRAGQRPEKAALASQLSASDEASKTLLQSLLPQPRTQLWVWLLYSWK